MSISIYVQQTWFPVPGKHLDFLILQLKIANSKLLQFYTHTHHHTEESIAIIVQFEETIQSNTLPKKKKKKLNSSEYLRNPY